MISDNEERLVNPRKVLVMDFVEHCNASFGGVILGYSEGLMDAERTGSAYLNKRQSHYKSHRQRLWISQHGICWWCGKECVFNGMGGEALHFTIDHIIPLSANGTNHWRNMVGSCHKCNINRDIYKWSKLKNISLKKSIPIDVRVKMYG
jgi:hypothetical protein